MTLTLQEKETVTRMLEDGIRSSAERLSKMSHTEWGVMSSSLNEIPAVRLLSWFERDKQRHIAGALSCRSILPIQMLVLFSEKSATAVTTAIVSPFSERLKQLDNLIPLTIGEVSNVLAQSVITRMADHFSIGLMLSVPTVSMGRKSNLLAGAFDRYDGREDVLMMSHVEMYAQNLAADCSIVLTIRSTALRQLLGSAALA